jgi:hypothetical protein
MHLPTPYVRVCCLYGHRNDDGVHKHDTEWLPNKGQLSQVFGPSLERVKLECQRAGYPARYTQLVSPAAVAKLLSTTPKPRLSEFE